MNWKPKTEEEVQAEQLCPQGLQPFTILEAVRTESKSAKNKGREMLKVKLNVHADDGFDYHVYDYIAPWFMEHKFRHFFVAVNRLKIYEQGNIDDVTTLVGAEGWADIGMDKGNGEYGPKSKVNDYAVKSDKSAKVEPEKPKSAAPTTNSKSPVGGTPADDDVPF